MKRTFSAGLYLAVILSLITTVIVRASDVDVAVVDVTVPTNSVTLTPGAAGSITINMSVTGNQAGTATFEVYRDWTLSGGTFTGSNPEEFTVGPRAGGAPATTFSTSGSVTVAAGQAAGTFTLEVGAFDITNSNTTGGKLAAGEASNYQVTVSTPPPPSDTTAPVITPNIVGTLGDNGWYVSDVTLTWTVTEDESPDSLVKTGCVDQNITADQAATDYSCSATSDGGSADEVTVTIKRDATPPTISGSAAPPPNAAGWNNTDVDVSFTCGDATSGIASCGPDDTLTGEGAGQSVAGVAVDNAGNTAGDTVSGINIDKTAPTVALVGGPDDGGSYYFGSVPAAPTCTASDALSGLAAPCSVSGYGTTVGGHTVTASAADNADNSASDSASYTVQAWTLSGFYQPVDMNVYNTVKGGSTVPLKFEVFAGPTELTSTGVVASFGQVRVNCDGSLPTDEIEVTTTGGTSLRYDTTGGQFIQNWQTPRQPGACYRVTMTTLDGSSLVAFFKLK